MRLNQTKILFIVLAISCTFSSLFADQKEIQEQLEEIGKVPNEEVMVVQRKFTRKKWRSELTPLSLGGVPFGTFRRTLTGGASYTLHVNDWFAWEAVNLVYSKNIFSSFADDLNAQPRPAGQLRISPEVQRLNFLVTTGFQFTPMYGKISTFSSWIAYIEPYFSLGAGLAKTETNDYFAFYPGIGFRIFFKEWISMRIDFRNYLYSEQFTDRSTGNTTASALRSNYSISLSLSFWLPKVPG